ncbi:hypothetical protein ACFCX4_06860, partial [Kitasatospora sp. NPDC056327]|uniref:hypothetical protein n=1 Tax=Kitasatospora sp. NPDC056327 TaxID=3345785 RepID=UPI0035D5BBB2
MDEETSLRRYGLRPAAADLDAIRALLGEHTARERHTQGGGDTGLLRLCCVQLFNSGGPDDVLLVRSAKNASCDAACAIEAELLLGHGPGATTAHLAAHPSPAAAAALERLRGLGAEGAFQGFSVAGFSADCDRYYQDEDAWARRVRGRAAPRRAGVGRANGPRPAPCGA